LFSAAKFTGGKVETSGKPTFLRKISSLLPCWKPDNYKNHYYKNDPFYWANWWKQVETALLWHLTTQKDGV